MTVGDGTDCDRLFVYGTLRRNGAAAELLASVGATFEAFGRTRGRLVDLGPYPGLIADEAGGSWARGELYHLSDPGAALPRLDAYEGDRFERAVCAVERADGTLAESWTYYYRGDALRAREIPAGEWPG